MATSQHLMVVSAIILIISTTVFVNGQGNSSSSDPTKVTGAPPHPLAVALPPSKIPGLIMLNYDETRIIEFNYTLHCDHPTTVYMVVFKSTHPDIANIESELVFNVSCTNALFTNPDYNNNNNNNNNSRSRAINPVDEMNYSILREGMTGTNEDSTNSSSPAAAVVNGGIITGAFNVTFKSYIIGRSFFLMFANKIDGPVKAKSSVPDLRHVGGGSGGSGNQSVSDNVKVPSVPRKGSLPPNTILKAMILVIKFPTTLDEVFRICSYVFIVMATMGMGIHVDLKVVITVMKRPLVPSIGLFSQYVCMPLIAYAVATLVPQPSPAISLGIFACGIMPGGGASNIYCHLLGGNLSLSVTMTTISSIVSLGLIPFWLYTLGGNFQDDTTSINVPFLKILETLALVILPVIAGILIRYKAPKLAKIIAKVLKPCLLVFSVFFLTFALYLNWYMFKMIRPMQLLAGCLLPYFGYLIGGLLAFFTRQSWTNIKTIAIETGIQNVGIAFLLLYLSLPPPDNILAIVGVAASSIMTPLPLLLLSIVYLSYNRYKQCKKESKIPDKSDKKEKGTDQLLEDGNSTSAIPDNEPSLWSILAQYCCAETNSSDDAAQQQMICKEMSVVNGNGMC